MNYQMKKLLEKISWLTRRWNLQIQVLKLSLHDHYGSWGFSFLTISYNFADYSLLSFEFRLPNKTNVRVFTVDHWDILFVRTFLFDHYSDLSERKLWGSRLNRWENLKIFLLNKIF